MNKFILIIFFISNLSLANSSNFEKANEAIELRKSAMQSIWLRIKRIAPYLELENELEYGPEIAAQDAREINILLNKTKSLWPEYSNLSGKALTNATPAVWALPDYFSKLYQQAEESAKKLETSLLENDFDQTDIAMCNLGNACGTCHASFRRLLTSQLANEASGWSGKYLKECSNN